MSRESLPTQSTPTDCGCWDFQQLRADYGAKCAEAEGERQIARWLSAEVEDLKLALHREAELADVRAAEVERLREERERALELLREVKPHVAHNGLRVRIWAALEAAQEKEPPALASGEFASRSHDRSAGDAGEA